MLDSSKHLRSLHTTQTARWKQTQQLTKAVHDSVQQSSHLYASLSSQLQSLSIQRAQVSGMLDELVGSRGEHEALLRERADGERKRYELLLYELETRHKEQENEAEKAEHSLSKERKAEHDYARRISELDSQRTRVERERSIKKSQLELVRGEPAKVELNISMLDKLEKEADDDYARVMQQLTHTEQAVEELQRQRRQSLLSLDELQLQVETVTLNIAKRKASIDEIISDRECEKIRASRHLDAYQALCDDRLQLRAEHLTVTSDITDVNRELEAVKKAYEKLRRKKETLVSLVRPLVVHRQELGSEMRQLEEHRRAVLAQCEAMKQSNEVLIVDFLQRETQDAELDGLIASLSADITEAESGIQRLQQRELELHKQTSLLTVQRNQQSENVSRLQSQLQGVKEDIALHRMQLKEMTRKLSEMTRNVSRSGEKYEVLKSQKSTLQTLVADIESTLSDIAEREKMYGNELFVLQSEMTEKERLMRAVEQRVKDSKHAVEKCRLDENRHRIAVRRVGDKNGELGLEVSQLRDILHGIEADVHSLRRHYAEAVTQRNGIGCLLIDRNDELLLQYEQHETMTQMLGQHEQEMAAGTEAMVRMSRETEDMKRRAEVARGQIPSVQAWGEKVHAKDALSRQLEDEKQQVEHLSTLLETPTTDKSKGFTRARLLTGDDPDADVLAREIEDGELRVEQKRKALLELELQARELGSVNARLRTRASEGREKAVRAGMEINETRAARERVGRQLMAAVSELSMWQARAVRLERDRRQREAQLQEMQARQQAGQQPDDQCEADWLRRERDKQRLREVLTSVKRSREEEEMLDRTLRSTAELRPNAYIQHDQLGLPKPYGGLAPFKPSVLGAQMRHFRIPQQREIQL